ncbi:carbonic anhydrase 1-like [Phlebotomus argentipes]|uniref:carbonic anhydrase 1-like n=1 Tax=Phlebotomus argentipes TaxID=94469 RepID=UPI0028933C15|nr:carbonic anhydrase 1-like [Phlebotomus argentipes]
MDEGKAQDDSSLEDSANDLSTNETIQVEGTKFDGMLKILPLNDDFPLQIRNYMDYTASHDDYGYDNTSEYPPYKWYQKWPACGGYEQSPIDIKPSDCKSDYSRYPFRFHYFHSFITEAFIENNGHSIQITFAFKGTTPMITSGLGSYQNHHYYYGTKYKFAQLHYHFGKTNDVGSEHTIKSKSYSMELHLIFIKSYYKSIEQAALDRNGLLVIAVLFEIAEKAESLPFVEYIDYVREAGKRIRVRYPGFKLTNFFKRSKSYIRYHGSLTSPPCSEAVQWLIGSNIHKISHRDIEKLRELQKFGASGDSMAGNYRPLQQRYGRSCYTSKTQY